MNIKDPITKRTRKLSPRAAAMLEFCRKYSSWHSVAKDSSTMGAVRQLAGMGLIQVTGTGQIRATDHFGNQWEYAGANETTEQREHHEKHLDLLDRQ